MFNLRNHWNQKWCGIPLSNIDDPIRCVSLRCILEPIVDDWKWFHKDETNESRNRMLAQRFCRGQCKNFGTLNTLCRSTVCSPELLKSILLAKEPDNKNPHKRVARIKDIPFTKCAPAIQQFRSAYGSYDDDLFTQFLLYQLERRPGKLAETTDDDDNKKTGHNKKLLNDLSNLYTKVVTPKPLTQPEQKVIKQKFPAGPSQKRGPISNNIPTSHHTTVKKSAEDIAALWMKLFPLAAPRKPTKSEAPKGPKPMKSTRLCCEHDKCESRERIELLQNHALQIKVVNTPAEVEKTGMEVEKTGMDVEKTPVKSSFLNYDLETKPSNVKFSDSR